MKYIKGQFQNNPESRGWFVGDFFPSDHPAKTDKFEIGFYERKKGYEMELHMHEQKVELIIIIKGKAEYQIDGDNIELNDGDYLFMQTHAKISAVFLEDTQLFALHAPSIPKDKVTFEE